ncbi:hypothetical protein GCM10027515_04500 [Schumannella luteola]|uniref:Right-handed parallel beta-helix repeat-containing protein n=1 Tax=Schumannella luteola TaxID=472059 RepID=A0A852YAV0_9MICO|nr:hypothetical protein [Schumannella luteola]NYG98414.1 hypothetical protein [Schumannella luteola]TPX01349.1 hypothetical protein FJ656_28615 [Schumannella luteola]
MRHAQRGAVLAGIALAIAATLTPIPASAASTAYYIDSRPGSSCSDSGPATQTQPWCSFTPANAHGPFSAGDSILLARGASWNQQLSVSGTGTANAWITLGAYGTGANPKILRSQGDNDLSVKLTNPDYWAVEHLEVGNAAAGILVYYSTKGHQGLRLTDITTHDNKGIWAVHSTGYPNFPGAPVDPWAAANNIVLSAGILVTVDPALALTASSDYAAKGITATAISGTHNINTLAFSATNEGPDHKQSGTFPLQDITVSQLAISDDDGHAGAAYQAAGLGCSDAFRFVGVTRAVVRDSSFFRGAACHTNSGTAQVFIGMVNDLTFVNNSFVGTPATGSNDQTAIDFEYFEKNVKLRNNYFAGNAGPGVEMLGIHPPDPAFPNSPLDVVTTEIDGNTFAHNNWAKTNATGSDASIHQGGTSSAPSGPVSDNLYTEPNKNFLGGDRIGDLVLTNNTAVTSPGNFAAAQFSGTQGANQWSYRYLSGGGWTDLPTFTASPFGGTWQRTAGQYVGPSGMAPLSGGDVARVWTAPYSGTVSIRGRLLKSDTGNGVSGGNGVTGSIVKITGGSATQVWPTSGGPQVIAGTDGVGVTTNRDSIAVAAGDKLYFIVGANGADNSYDTASWTPSIAYTSSTTPYAWNFTTPTDFEAWNQNAWNQLSAAEVTGGALTLTSAGTDPYILSQDDLALASSNRYLHLRMKNQTSDPAGAIYFTTASSPAFSGDKVVTFTSAVNATGYTDYTVDMGTNPNWTGTIKQLRLDPTGSPGVVSIDAISVGSV